MVTFKDSPKGWEQDYAYGVLTSLCLFVDAYKRSQKGIGVAQVNARHEMWFHYQMATKTIFRMFHLSQNVITQELLESLSENGTVALCKFMEENEDLFELDLHSDL